MVTDEVVYMTADVEDEYIVAQANEPLDEERPASSASVSSCRCRDEIHGGGAQTRVDFMDVSPEAWWFPWPRP